MSNRTTQPTERQRAQLAALKTNFGLSDDDIERCLFFSERQDNPWIPPELLIFIARATKQFSSIDSEYSNYVRELNQIIYKGSVVDLDGREITRTGVATIGERPGGYEIDPHKLAESRALGAALTDQGFNPFKTNFVTGMSTVGQFPSHTGRQLSDEEKRLAAIEFESNLRKKELGAIHGIAEKKGLIVTHEGGKDMSRYRNWMLKNFDVHTAALLDAETRASVIAELDKINSDENFLLELPAEMRADAAIA